MAYVTLNLMVIDTNGSTVWQPCSVRAESIVMVRELRVYGPRGRRNGSCVVVAGAGQFDALETTAAVKAAIERAGGKA